MDVPIKEAKVVKEWLDRMLHMGQFAVKGKHDHFLGIDKRKLTRMSEQGMWTPEQGMWYSLAEV